jgi:hypothetical protein
MSKEEPVKSEAVRLLEEGLHLGMYGERAPGGDETWGKWFTKVELYLRALPHMCGAVSPMATTCILLPSHTHHLDDNGGRWPAGIDLSAVTDELASGEDATQAYPVPAAEHPFPVGPALEQPIFGADHREVDPHETDHLYPLLSLCGCGREITKAGETEPWQH